MPDGNKQQILARVKDGIADLTELEVHTVTGVIEKKFLTTPGGAGNDKGASILNWEELIKEAVETTGTVRLAAATSVKFDGDTNLFIGAEVPESILNAHAKAVEAAQEVRRGLIEVFKESLKFEPRK